MIYIIHYVIIYKKLHNIIGNGYGMKVISGRFLSKTELINKILRDIIIAILFIAILVFIYFQIRSPIPVKFIFKSLFQDVKNNVIE